MCRCHIIISIAILATVGFGQNVFAQLCPYKGQANYAYCPGQCSILLDQVLSGVSQVGGICYPLSGDSCYMSIVPGGEPFYYPPDFTVYAIGINYANGTQGYVETCPELNSSSEPPPSPTPVQPLPPPSATPPPVPSPTPFVTISNVHVTQVVNDFGAIGISKGQYTCDGSANCPYDLILRKNTVIQVDVNTNNSAEPISATLTASLPDGSSASTKPVLINSTTQTINVLPLSPLVVSVKSSLTITVTSNEDQSQLGSTTRIVRVSPSKQLNIAYFPMAGPYGSVPAGDVATHAEKSDTFIQGIFPISEGAVNEDLGNQISGSTIIPLNKAGPIDILWLMLARTVRFPLDNYSVGLVPPNYFPFHQSSLGGVTYKSINVGPFVFNHPNAALVTDNYYTTTAHEMSHTFGLDHLNTAPNYTTFGGYWVDMDTPISTAPNKVIDFFGPRSSVPYRIDNVWITPTEYYNLFNFFSNASSDPQVIVVAGTLNKNGQVNLMPMYFLPNGSVTPNVSGSDGVVQALDSNGQVISNASFFSSYDLLTDAEEDIPTDQSVFLVQLPYSEGIQSLQIIENGNVVSTVNPNSTLLVDTVDEISSSSFLRNPVAERARLANLAARIGRSIQSCKKGRCEGVDEEDHPKCNFFQLSQILNLRQQLNLKLVDSAQVDDPLQLTKSQAMRTVDRIFLQLIPDVTTWSRRDILKIRVFPNEMDEHQQIFNIASYTQGRYGTVSLSHDGEIVYRPDGDDRESDSFSVTIHDIDGDTVTKTISLVEPHGTEFNNTDKRALFSGIEKIMNRIGK